MVLENVNFHIDNSTIVIDPKPGHTGSAAHNLQPIIRAVQSTHPAAEQCERARLLVNGEYVDLTISLLFSA
ncbi:hypothetical protein [Leptolyngbya sp. GGD]|uniref:hypothetical protein n=1 Tax=Leptolyngbya sp. GGD TaxID=2997907 RepID=UPI00227B116A|nr:hypothetical protein [Leptolyngbya sp. GGD]MCY6492114.1 hypothetical protein [Leptolyngbya sp. GGD]